MKHFFEKDIHLGILKGGQLGRMLLQPCMNFGIIPHIMDIDAEAPARPYCHNFTTGDSSSFDDVVKFGKNLDALTLEFEHVNLDALKQLKQDGVRVFPDPSLIEIVQDKGLQKQFYQTHQFPTPDFELVNNKAEAASKLGPNGIVQKKRVAGYDGRGVAIINSKDDLHLAFDEPSVIEEKIAIAKEISVLVARNESGQVEMFPCVEMVAHAEANMLDYLCSPANLSALQTEQAMTLAKELAEKLNLVGLLAVEMFLTQDDRIMINEIAPRTHNSGHHTIEANGTSQFVQQVRAIFNLPLGSTQTHSPAAMVNIVGAPGHEGPVVYQGLNRFLEMPSVYVHLYGKKHTRPFRKMGHITVIRPNIHQAIEIAQQIKAEVKAISCQK